MTTKMSAWIPFQSLSLPLACELGHRSLPVHRLIPLTVNQILTEGCDMRTDKEVGRWINGTLAIIVGSVAAGIVGTAPAGCLLLRAGPAGSKCPRLLGAVQQPPQTGGAMTRLQSPLGI